jgi:peptide/nickel transport system permease protein
MSLLVAILGTLICAVIGSSIGFAAAHFRGIVDEIVMMLVDFQASLPYMILALAVIAFFENNIFLFIGIPGDWTRDKLDPTLK